MTQPLVPKTYISIQNKHLLKNKQTGYKYTSEDA